MEYFKNVRSAKKPAPEVINDFFVYINTDIKEIIVENNEDPWTSSHIEYEFNQTKYTKDEYISLLSERNASLEIQLTDTQLALVEFYEMMI